MIGQTAGHYRIEEKVGAGGMGVVYRAHDEILDRDVAIKVLTPETLGDEAAQARFRKEALALSRLNHPNICTIYDVGETGGQAFLVMEYVDGRSLRALALDGGLPGETVLRYGVQIADAVAHAHSRGIVHRDLKSANVMVTPEGRIKVLDFGLARRIRQTKVDEATCSMVTEVGTVVGTLHYMAPELLRGGQADMRSDLWALGVVLHEMAAGELPFPGQTGFEVSGAILNHPPRALPAQISPALQAVIGRCLAKVPGDRYQRAEDVRAAQEQVQSGAAALPWRSGPTQRHSVAVLPLRNLSGDPDQEYFVEGTHEALITDLAKISALRVIARSSSMRYQGTEKPLLEIAKELNVDVVLTGSVARSGNRVRITAQLVNAATEEHLWAERYEQLRDVLSLQDEIATAIARQIQSQLTPQEEARLAGAPQVNAKAYDAYLKGRFHWRKQSPPELNTALEYFQLALQEDPNYALAYAGTADVWLARGDRGFFPPREAFPKATAAALKALELDHMLAEPHFTLGFLRSLEWDWSAAEKGLRRAIELNPNHVEAHLRYSHLLIGLRRTEEWQVEIQRALELDPLNFLVPCFYGSHLVYVGRFDEAIAQLRRVLTMQPDFSGAHLGLWGAFYKKGVYDEALAEAKRFFAALGDHEVVESLDRGGADAGYQRAMRHAAATLAARSERSHVPGIRIARVYAHARETDQALKWLESAYEQRESPLGQIGIGWDWDALRGDPRFQDLLRRLKLPVDG